LRTARQGDARKSRLVLNLLAEESGIGRRNGQNHPQLALVPLKKLLSLEPSNLDARGIFAGALMGVNRFDEAAEQYRKLTAEDATDVKA
jgi:cytochrome c-type biogenesis protein CcmH/NrfG